MSKITLLQTIQKSVIKHWLLFSLLVILSGFYFWGIDLIPFHPDESTQIFMSQDVRQWLQNPTSLAWQPEKKGDLAQHYRLVDAPMTRYLLGLGRMLARNESPNSDWDWSMSWEENLAGGAMPSRSLLLSGRMTLALLFPFTLLFLYASTIKISGRLGGMIVVILFGTNCLILLHTRRAMAEPALIFGIAAVLASFIYSYRRPWLVALAMAIAFSAKQTALALFPVGLIAVMWLPHAGHSHTKQKISNALEYLVIFSLLTFLLNPVYWQRPLQSLQASWQERKELLSDQVNAIEEFQPGQVITGSRERTLAMLAHLYLAPPMFAELGNYRSSTSNLESRYLSMPGQNLWHDRLSAGILLGVTLLGLIWAILRIRNPLEQSKRELTLLLLATFLLAFELILTVPLAWQRYYLPLVPFVCIWAGTGLVWRIKTSRWILSRGRRFSGLSEIFTQFPSDSWMP